MGILPNVNRDLILFVHLFVSWGFKIKINHNLEQLWWKKKSRNFATSEFCVFNRFFGKQHCWVLRLILKSILIKCFIKIEIRSALMIKYKSVHTNNLSIYIFVMYRYTEQNWSYFSYTEHIHTTFRFSLLQQPDFKIYIYDNFCTKFSDSKSPMSSFSQCERKVR